MGLLRTQEDTGSIDEGFVFRWSHYSPSYLRKKTEGKACGKLRKKNEDNIRSLKNCWRSETEIKKAAHPRMHTVCYPEASSKLSEHSLASASASIEASSLSVVCFSSCYQGASFCASV